MTCSTDRYAATYVVAPNLGPPDCQTADFTDIQSAINALPAGGGKIFAKAGTYVISSTVQISASNVQIQGEGIGITNIIADTSMTDGPAIKVYDSKVGYDLALAADTAKGDTTVTLAPQDAASIAKGDAVLLYSNKSVDCAIATKHAGEIKRVVTADAQTGVVTLDDRIYDAYLVSDTAKIAKISLLRNIQLCDFSVTKQPPPPNSNLGLTHFRFIDNLQLQRLEAHDAYGAGIELVSVINSNISDCYIHDIGDVQQTAGNLRYGIVVGSASQNISISGCRFSHTRHAVTTGGSSGAHANGVQRNITVSNCTSMAADTAHFDTHDPAENVSFVGCVAIGGIPAAQTSPQAHPDEIEVIGFQMRGANCSIIGCSVLQAIGKGIMILEDNKAPRRATPGPTALRSRGIAGVKSVTNGAGVGIFLDSSGTSRHTITGNVIKQCEGSAIIGAGGNNDTVVSGNVIDGTNFVVPGASISFDNAERVTICGNTILNNATGRPIEMKGSFDAIVINNSGYNPVGLISNPWLPSGDLTNDGAGSSTPANSTVYTVRQSPKTIIVTQGEVTEIAIDGTPMGSLAGSFKLGIGETTAISYVSVPTTTVWAE